MRVSLHLQQGCRAMMVHAWPLRLFLRDAVLLRLLTDLRLIVRIQLVHVELSLRYIICREHWSARLTCKHCWGFLVRSEPLLFGRWLMRHILRLGNVVVVTQNLSRHRRRLKRHDLLLLRNNFWLNLWQLLFAATLLLLLGTLLVDQHDRSLAVNFVLSSYTLSQVGWVFCVALWSVTLFIQSGHCFTAR